MEKHSKIYVAGHKGLVGSAITRNLQENGFHNLVLRDSNQLDLRNPMAVQEFFKTEQPEYVFLAAAKVGGIAANNTYRADFIYDNLMIQNNVIHESYQNQVKKLLFLGSTCIYPKNAPQPIKESYLLTDVLEYTNEPYAIAKIAGIKMCESYNLQYGTQFLSAMPTNLYGPNDNFDLEKAHVLPALLRKIVLGKALQEGNWEAIKQDLNRLPINGVSGENSKEQIEAILNSFGIALSKDTVNVEIWGTGTPLREFLWVDDMAEACLFLMQHATAQTTRVANEEVRNTHFNVGIGEDISIGDLALLIAEIVGYNGKFIFNTSKPDGTFRKLTDVTKINSLGWKASTSLRTGIKKMVSWYLK